MEEYLNISNAIAASNSLLKSNIRKVISKSSKIDLFHTFLINIEIDIEIGAIDILNMISFFNVYIEIGLDLSIEEITVPVFNKITVFENIELILIISIKNIK